MNAVISLRGVKKSFGSLRILDGVDLDVQGGEKIALMGASGCGKTTLLRCINALERPCAGTLLVNGADLSDPGLDRHRFRARIGMVFQQYNLFPHLTVLENLMLAPVKVLGQPPGAVRERALTLLERVGIPDKADAYPEQLSGGQKQRVAIARSLAMEPALLLLDEPTSALDPPMRREVLEVIEAVAKDGMTILMVTHELGFARKMANRVVFMDGGRIVEEGPPEALFANPAHPQTRAYLQALD